MVMDGCGNIQQPKPCEVLHLPWIASRSRKLSGRSSAESYCASAPSGYGCVHRRHSVQSCA
jgi:hypothetical protein